MLAAGQQRLHARAALDPERPGAFRAVEFVRRQGEQIDAERAHVDRNFARRLHGVGVHQRATFVGDRRDIGDRLNGSDFVIGVHHRDERGVVGDAPRDAVGRDDAGLVDGNERRPPAAFRQGLQRIQHRLVFDRAGDQVTTAGRLERLRPRREWRSCPTRFRRP